MLKKLIKLKILKMSSVVEYLWELRNAKEEID